MFPTVQPLPRDKRLQAVIDEIATLDRAFDYNVPAKDRQSLPDRELLRAIKRTYSSAEFLIDDLEPFRRYARHGDLVQKKGDMRGIVGLKPLDVAALMGLTDERNGIGVVSKEYQQFEVPLADLVAYGVLNAWSSSLARHFPGAADASTVSALDRDQLKRFLAKGKTLAVKYSRQEPLIYGPTVKDGALGLVHGISRGEAPYVVLWRNGHGTDTQSAKSLWPHWPCVAHDAASLRLVLPNEVAIDDLLRRHYDDPGELNLLQQ